MSKSVTRTIWIGTDDDGAGGAYGSDVRYEHGMWADYGEDGDCWSVAEERPGWLTGLALPPPGLAMQYTITITSVEG